MIDRSITARNGGDVRLRTLVESDGPAFAAHVRGDLERLSVHLPWPARTTTDAEASAWIAAYARGEGGRIGVAGIWEQERLLGGVLLMGHDEVNANAELGCWVVAAGEGRGLVAEGCRALLAHAVTLGVERVVWRVATANLRSRRLAERLGFAHEGTARSAYVLRGVRLDTEVYALVGAALRRAATAG